MRSGSAFIATDDERPKSVAELARVLRDLAGIQANQADESRMSDVQLAAALREIADKLRYELLLIGARREPDILRAAADRLERRTGYGLPHP